MSENLEDDLIRENSENTKTPISIDASQAESENMKKYFDEYYKLKSKYETSNKKEINKILNNQNLSWKEKRSQYQRLVPKCVLCHQSGGTNFSIQYIKGTKSRILKARCGNKQTPCSLDIVLKTGRYILAPNYIEDLEEMNKKLKNLLINDKNGLLFGFTKTDDILNSFDAIKSAITTNYVEYETCIREYYNVIDNQDNKKKLDELITTSFDKINNIKEYIKQFNDEDNNQFVLDAVDVYINELTPILKQIMQLKYSKNIVWYNVDTNTYHLIQERNTIKDIELDVEGPQVVSFNINLEIKKKEEEEEEEWRDE